MFPCASNGSKLYAWHGLAHMHQTVVDRVLQTYDPAMVKLLRTELARVKSLK